MKRFALGKLDEWKGSRFRKPLVLNGARQVGKTWLLKEFGRLRYASTAYIAFDRNPEATTLFGGGFDFSRILAGLQALSGVRIVPGETLVILDEIQLCPAAIVALKAWNEERNEYHLACAGSLAGLSLLPGSGWPVGKTNRMDVFPMSFGEFLAAIGDEALWENAVLSGDGFLLNAMLDKLTDRLRLYLLVGGMPAAVEAFAETKSLDEARSRQSEILRDYDRDFSKHVPAALLPRLRAVWDSLPRQLSKIDKRFVASEVEIKGASSKTRARDLRDPFEWLEGAGLAYRVWNETKPAIPLSAYRNHTFKLFGVDTGLLAAQSALPARAVLDGNAVFTHFKGALAEQFVQQELRAAAGDEPATWMPSNSTAEIDFLIQGEDGIVPVEVKAERNLKAKSLAVYRAAHSPALSIRTSLAPHLYSEGLLDLPLPAIGAWRQYARRNGEHVKDENSR
jgi:predicted AAA+ superfamily ATPase